MIRFQAGSGTLQGVRLFAVNNTSSPPVTQMNDHNFEFFLPAGAKIEEVQARAPHGQPIKAEAVPQAEKNRYAIAFPLRPGETQFQLEFTLPYSGEIKIDPKPLYPAEHFVVVLPKTMEFKAADPPSFEAIHDPSQGDSTVEVAKATKPGQALAFTLRGEGTITESPAETASGSAEQQGPTTSRRTSTSNRQPSRWRDSALQSMLLTLCKNIAGPSSEDLRYCSSSALGWSRNGTKRQSATSAAAISAAKPATTTREYDAVLRPTAIAPVTATTAVAKSSMLLEALKEEMFQLEVDRKQGKITSGEYDQAKAALDLTLDRALKRQG